MVFVLKQLFSLIRLLHSENSEKQIALAIVLGVWMALNPIYSLQALVVLAISLCFRVQLGFFFLSWLGFGLLSISLYSGLNSLGYSILSQPSLKSSFVAMQKTSLSLTYFNNTVVMGALAICIAFSLPLYFLFKFLVKEYRGHVVESIKGSKLLVVLKSSPLFKVYEFYEKYRV